MPLPLCPGIIGEQLEVFSEGAKADTKTKCILTPITVRQAGGARNSYA